tara:strand:+ start:1721 stop:1987 length:267 start_codon:yes stop_codon:yes gene_type:complete
MSWSYRIISHPTYGMQEKEEKRTYQIHEVFLEKGKVVGYSMDGFIPNGDSRNDLKQRLRYMEIAFVRPVIQVEDLDNTVSVFGDPACK